MKGSSPKYRKGLPCGATLTMWPSLEEGFRDDSDEEGEGARQVRR